MEVFLLNKYIETKTKDAESWIKTFLFPHLNFAGNIFQGISNFLPYLTLSVKVLTGRLSIRNVYKEIGTDFFESPVILIAQANMYIMANIG